MIHVCKSVVVVVVNKIFAAKLVLVKNTSSVAHPRLNKNLIVDKGILIFSYKKLVHKKNRLISTFLHT